MGFFDLIKNAFVDIVKYRVLRSRAQTKKSISAYRLDMAAIKAKNEESAKTKAEAERVKVQTRKELIETVGAVLKITLTLGTAYGFILVFVYCFRLANFFPSGFSVGDTALLLFVAIAFGIVAFVTAILGFLPFTVLVTFPVVRRAAPLPALATSSSLANYEATGLILCWSVAVLGVYAGYDFLSHMSEYDFASFGTDFFWPFLILGLIIFAELFFLGLTFEKERSEQVSPVSVGDYFNKKWFDFIYGGFLWVFGTVFWCGVGGAICLLEKGFFYALSALLGGFSIALSLMMLDNAQAEDSSPERRSAGLRFSALFAAIALALPPILSLDLSSSVLKQFVMKNFGIYSERAALWVSPENLTTLQGAAQLYDSPLSVCRNSDGSAIVTDLTIWWHGIGSRTYVELIDFEPNGKIKSVDSFSRRVELKSDGARLVQSHNVRCTELGDDLLFRSNHPEPDLSISPKNIINESLGPFINIAAPLDMPGLHISRIDIIGHADPMVRRASSNEKLGVERATEIKKLIICTFGDGGKILGENILMPKSSGATKPLKDCSAIADSKQAKECNAVNRRVQIRVHYADSKAVNSSSVTADQKVACK